MPGVSHRCRGTGKKEIRLLSYTPRTNSRISGPALLVALAGCAAFSPSDHSKATSPSEVARAVCLQHHPRDVAVCTQFHLPNRASETAYGTCLQYNRIDPQRCKDLRLTFEADLRGYLEKAPAAESRRSGANEEPARPEMPRQGQPVPYHTAQELYDATSKDAQTFRAALLIPEVREKIERALHQQLSDEALGKLAAQAQAESLYWYKYMKGLQGSGNQ